MITLVERRRLLRDKTAVEDWRSSHREVVIHTYLLLTVPPVRDELAAFNRAEVHARTARGVVNTGPWCSPAPVMPVDDRHVAAIGEGPLLGAHFDLGQS